MASETRILHHPMIAPNGRVFDKEHADSLMARANNGGWEDRNQSGTQAAEAVITTTAGEAETSVSAPATGINQKHAARKRHPGNTKTSEEKADNPEGNITARPD